MPDVVFNAQINIETKEAVQRMEGSLNKVGLAYEKELEKRGQSTLQSAVSGISSRFSSLSGIGMSAMSGIMNPMMSTQEIEAQLVPKLTSAIAAAVPQVGKGLSQIAEITSQQMYARSRYVTTGAKQAVSGMAAEQAALGNPLTSQQIDELLLIMREQKTAEFDAQKLVAARTGAVLPTEAAAGVEDLIERIPEAISQMWEQGKETATSVFDLIKKELTDLISSVFDLSNFSSNKQGQ